MNKTLIISLLLAAILSGYLVAHTSYPFAFGTIFCLDMFALMFYIGYHLVNRK